MRKDLTKQDLYDSVKTLVECEHNHIHLPQQKLYTLFSIAFQYLLFRSTKDQGAYIIRIEDSSLADKMAKRSKDQTTRKFMQSLLIPRKLKYGQSTFYLDSFHPGSWNLTRELSPERIKGALIVKNASDKLMEEINEEDPDALELAALPDGYYYHSLREFVPKSLLIAFEKEFEDTHKIEFPFIHEDERKKTLSGVKISVDIDIEE